MKYCISWAITINGMSKDEALHEAANILLTETSAQDLHCEEMHDDEMDDDEKPQAAYTIATGNAFEGLQLTGVFNDYDEAFTHAERICQGAVFNIVKIEPAGDV